MTRGSHPRTNEGSVDLMNETQPSAFHIHWRRMWTFVVLPLICALPASSQSKIPWCTQHIDSANLPQQWDYSAAYGLVWNAHARTAHPTPATFAGNAKLALNMTRCTMLLVAPETFLWSKTQGQPSSVGFGTTKIEFNQILFYSEAPYPGNPLSRGFALDYTVTVPTNGTQPIIENYSHQFLATFAWDQRPWMSYEVDAGDLLGPRVALPGFTQTGLLTLIASFNGKKDGKSAWNFPIEVDAGTASDSGPSSVVSSEGVSYKFANGLSLKGALLTGLTANDPKVGFAFTIKYAGNFKGKAQNGSNLRQNSALLKRSAEGRK